jgi:hypothetical protein
LSVSFCLFLAIPVIFLIWVRLCLSSISLYVSILVVVNMHGKRERHVDVANSVVVVDVDGYGTEVDRSGTGSSLCVPASCAVVPKGDLAFFCASVLAGTVSASKRSVGDGV